MITIDGSEGEGGGQVLRYSAALSLLTGEAFTIRKIRGGRAKPGMMRQHVTALEAACAIGGAECSGLTVGASELTFRPGSVTPGEYHFAVGTAGSTGLVLQTVLVPLMLADAPSRLVIEGGTHAMAAPPFEFLQKTLLPILERMGPKLSITLERHGFYPRGGGRIVVDIDPSPLRQIECIERGAFKAGKVEALVAGIPFDIADRELNAARKVLAEWPDEAFAPMKLPAENGPGNALLMKAEFEHVTEVMSGFGKLGVPAERLSKTAAKRMAGYLASPAFAGPYLQDQLLLPFAMAGGGAFTTVKISEHTKTAVTLVERFSGRDFRFSETSEGSHLVEVS
ncbi:RNA 3'-terminal phosphate cyclase [Porphyrobacter algicida]|uniref:RNA 3'-terminal phosphate cyclase n=1 Tax=Qipengyuania algicida TaxID=1836209 RepID=A0A845AHK9_9SPHN|nr:RNA 3'-terminal phosphate cyclase [Qipengyuania algicida]MXP29114.1 RNA 3'-terminal phosphate cyclase [Qipengyuania algicida]